MVANCIAFIEPNVNTTIVLYPVGLLICRILCHTSTAAKEDECCGGGRQKQCRSSLITEVKKTTDALWFPSIYLISMSGLGAACLPQARSFPGQRMFVFYKSGGRLVTAANSLPSVRQRTRLCDYGQGQNRRPTSQNTKENRRLRSIQQQRPHEAGLD